MISVAASQGPALHADDTLRALPLAGCLGWPCFAYRMPARVFLSVIRMVLLFMCSGCFGSVELLLHGAITGDRHMIIMSQSIIA